MVSYNLYFKQITNKVKYDDYHYSDFQLQLYDVLNYIIPLFRRSETARFILSFMNEGQEFINIQYI